MPATRFAYNACTVGVGAVLTTPTLAASWAPACLPVIGGRSGTVVGHTVWPTVTDPVLAFDLAETSITGMQIAAGVYQTVIRKTVTNLNILNWLTASIGVEITFTYTRRPCTPPPKQRDLVEVNINLFQDFVIDTPGQLPPPPLGMATPIDLNREIPTSAGRNFKVFKGGPGVPGQRSIDQIRPLRAHHKHGIGEPESIANPCGHGHGYIYTALAEPAPPLPSPFTYDDNVLEFGKLDIPLPPGSGKMEIYVGEWAGQPYWQSITFLRVEFENVQDQVNPNSTFSGQIVIDDGDDGVSFP